MEHMERIAFLGLGIMGSPMARRLLAAGYPLTVWNRTASRAEPLRAEGASVAASPAEAVRDADVVITMLADPTAVREVVAGIARHLRPGTTLIEASTIGPQALEEVAALLPGGVALVDAPVMGSADRAASGPADLPLLRIVHDWLVAFPDAGSEDLGQIVRHIRAQQQAGPPG